MNWLRFLTLVTVVLHSQQINAQCKLIYHSKDLSINSYQSETTVVDTAAQITAVESRGVLSNYLILRYGQSRRKLILKNSIWGFIDSHQAIWRSYQKELFLVRTYNTNWVEYIIQRPIGTRLTAVHEEVMYSRTLDSKIEATWSNAMKDVLPGYLIR